MKQLNKTMTNYEIAQQISTRIGTSPVPFESVYSIALSIYQELGGTEETFADIYSILLEILPLATEVAHIIDDNITSTGKTWSSSKIVAEMADIDFSISIVQELPQSGDSHTVYFVPAITSGVTNVYDEYMYISNTWEMIGSTAIDLTDYATKIYVDNGLALKQNTLSGYNNIYIGSNNFITALGYTYDENNESIWHGNNCSTSAAFTHAEGNETMANNDYAHTEGIGTQALNVGEHAEGMYNISHDNGGSTLEGSTLFSIGIGEDDSNRYNGIEVMKNGDIYVYGVGYYDGTQTKEDNPDIMTLQDIIHVIADSTGLDLGIL